MRGRPGNRIRASKGHGPLWVNGIVVCGSMQQAQISSKNSCGRPFEKAIGSNPQARPLPRSGGKPRLSARLPWSRAGVSLKRGQKRVDRARFIHPVFSTCFISVSKTGDLIHFSPSHKLFVISWVAINFFQSQSETSALEVPSNFHTKGTGLKVV